MQDRDEKVERLLSRNVEKVINEDHLRAALRTGKKLRVKLGIDPTSPDLHLGHAVVLRKLREFQDLGCMAVLIIGDFTALIGDPSGRDKARPTVTEAEVKQNLKTYLKQAEMILDLGRAEIAYNSSWLWKLNGPKLLGLLGLVSLQQIIEREDFASRLSTHHSISMRELLYPVMQAYDSAAIKADVELGGTDQTFNLLMGRDLMGKLGTEPQDILTVPILVGLDGKQKMSKSLRNYIGLTDAPDEMFGKIMSLPDGVVVRYFELCTDLTGKEAAALKKDLGPKGVKTRLGFEIVKQYYGEKSAREAEEKFEKLFSKKEIPADIPELGVKSKSISPLELVLASGVAKSKSEGRRLIEQGGFELDGKTINDPQATIDLKGGEVARIGKKRFFRVIHRGT